MSPAQLNSQSLYFLVTKLLFHSNSKYTQIKAVFQTLCTGEGITMLLNTEKVNEKNGHTEVAPVNFL